MVYKDMILFQWEILYNFGTQQRLLATFKTCQEITEPATFKPPENIIGFATSVVLKHPRGGKIYRLMIHPLLVSQINKYLSSVGAENIIWNSIIYMEDSYQPYPGFEIESDKVFMLKN